MEGKITLRGHLGRHADGQYAKDSNSCSIHDEVDEVRATTLAKQKEMSFRAVALLFPDCSRLSD